MSGIDKIELEIEYIKKAIDSLAIRFDSYLEKEDERSRRLAALEQFKAISDIQSLSYQRDNKEHFDQLWTELKKLDGKGKNTLQQAVLWISLAVGSSSLIMWIIKMLGK